MSLFYRKEIYINCKAYFVTQRFRYHSKEHPLKGATGWTWKETHLSDLLVSFSGFQNQLLKCYKQSLSNKSSVCTLDAFMSDILNSTNQYHCSVWIATHRGWIVTTCFLVSCLNVSIVYGGYLFEISGVIYLFGKHLIPRLTVNLIRIILLFENAAEKQKMVVTRYFKNKKVRKVSKLTHQIFNLI